MMGLILYLIRNPLVDRQDFAHLQRVGELLINRIRVQADVPQRVEQAVIRADEMFAVRVLIVRPDLSLLADSRRGKSQPLNPFSLRQLRLQRGYIRDGDGNVWLFVPSQLANGYYLVLSKQRAEGVALLFGQRLRDIWRDELLPPLIQVGVLALLIALILSYGMSRWITASLQRIALAAKRLAKGEFSRIEPEGPQEVKQLARVFNHMTEQVQLSQQSQRDFVANVSHELKTPLTSIQGFSQAILDGTVTNQEEMQNAAAIILSESDRMQRMVSNLLELARIDAGIINLKLQPIVLDSLLNSVINKLKPIADQAKVLIRMDRENVPNIFGDSDRLFQVFTNLVENAIKHSLPGDSVKISSRYTDSMAEIMVSDTGSGISLEEHNRVFERFYQVDKSRKGGGKHGVGLGLSITREIVLAHGGSIHVENNTPQGSIFVVKLPLA